MKRILSALLLLPLLFASRAFAAIAVSEPVAEVLSTTDGTSFAGTAFTPTANSLLVVYVFAGDTTAVATMTGGGLTWTLRNQYSAVNSMYVFTAQVGGSPASTTPTFDCTGDSATGAGIAVFQVTGHDTGTPYRQSQGNNNSSTNPSVTFASAALTANAVIEAVGVDRTAPAYTPTAGFTETVDGGWATPTAGMEAAFIAGGDTATGHGWTGATGAWVGMLIEINVAPTGTLINQNNVSAAGDNTNGGSQ